MRSVALGRKIRSFIRDTLCAVVWIYATTKLFFFDIDQIVFSAVAPDWSWLLNLRVLPILVALLLAVTVMGRKQFVLAIAYLVGFPFVVVFWKVPKILFRLGNWVLTLAVLNAFLSIFTDIPYRLIYFVLYVTCCVVIWTSASSDLILISMVGLLGCVSASYVKSIVDAFRTPQVLALYTLIFDSLSKRKGLTDAGIPQVRMKVSGLLPKEHNDELNRFQNEVILSQICSFLADKLRDYNDSEVHIVGGIISIFRLIAIMLVTYCILYYSAAKIDADAFTSPSPVTWFDFLYVSFDNMLFNMNASNEVNSALAKALSMSQRFLSALIGLILLVVLFEVRKKKHSRQIEAAAKAAEKASAVSAQAVTTQFDYSSLDEAIADLRDAETSMYAALAKVVSFLQNRNRPEAR